MTTPVIARLALLGPLFVAPSLVMSRLPVTPHARRQHEIGVSIPVLGGSSARFPNRLKGKVNCHSQMAKNAIPAVLAT